MRRGAKRPRRRIVLVTIIALVLTGSAGAWKVGRDRAHREAEARRLANLATIASQKVVVDAASKRVTDALERWDQAARAVKPGDPASHHRADEERKRLDEAVTNRRREGERLIQLYRSLAQSTEAARR
jgi:hypothetical protein